MVSRRWLFTLTMCFSPSSIFRAFFFPPLFRLLLLPRPSFFLGGGPLWTGNKFLNSFVCRVCPFLWFGPLIQIRLVPSWSFTVGMVDHSAVSPRVLPLRRGFTFAISQWGKNGAKSTFTQDLNARSARHVQLFSLFCFFFFLLRRRRRVDLYRIEAKSGILTLVYWNSKQVERLFFGVVRVEEPEIPFSSSFQYGKKHFFFLSFFHSTANLVILFVCSHWPVAFIELEGRKNKRRQTILLRSVSFAIKQTKKKQNKKMVVVFPRMVACNLTIIFVYEPEISSGRSSVVLNTDKKKKKKKKMTLFETGSATRRIPDNVNALNI